jgi:hypothetical protein
VFAAVMLPAIGRQGAGNFSGPDFAPLPIGHLPPVPEGGQRLNATAPASATS